MSVRVHTLSGDQYCFDGYAPQTIWQLKGLIKERLGVARRMQKVFDGTCELANNYALSHATIDGNALTVALANDSECKVCNEISIRFCSGCFSACYCSEACQLKDWIVHRRYCERQHRQHRQNIIAIAAQAPNQTFLLIERDIDW